MKKLVIVLLITWVLSVFYAEGRVSVYDTQPGLRPPVNVRIVNNPELRKLSRRVTSLEEQIQILCSLPTIRAALQEKIRLERRQNRKTRKEKY